MSTDAEKRYYVTKRRTIRTAYSDTTVDVVIAEGLTAEEVKQRFAGRDVEVWEEAVASPAPEGAEG